jgi:hypothetical protein
MSDKPSYLGLLNAIATGECRAHQYFDAWIAKTSNEDLKAVLTKVSLREAEHGLAFTKRLNELGFGVQEKPDPRAEEAMAVASSDLSDLEKMERLGLGKPLNLFDNVFTDHSIDIQTGELLGRYIAEEHDTNRLFQACQAQLSAGRSAEAPSALSEQVACLSDRVEGLCSAIEELRDLVCAQMTAAGPAVVNGDALVVADQSPDAKARTRAQTNGRSKNGRAVARAK